MSLRPTRQLTQVSFKLFACALAVIFAVACASTDQSEEDVTDDAAETGSEFQQADQDEVEMNQETVSDTTVSDATGALDLQTVYFDFDRADIRENVRPSLRKNGEQLRTTSASVRLEGYCDERGDEEYNLALGERRANSVKRYLENLGVPRSQMRTLSYGEAKPAVAGHNESAWRYNRRVEFTTE
jgi:peptidoglycan-associated lipoprotein